MPTTFYYVMVLMLMAAPVLTFLTVLTFFERGKEGTSIWDFLALTFITAVVWLLFALVVTYLS